MLAALVSDPDLDVTFLPSCCRAAPLSHPAGAAVVGLAAALSCCLSLSWRGACVKSGLVFPRTLALAVLCTCLLAPPKGQSSLLVGFCTAARAALAQTGVSVWPKVRVCVN